MTALTVKASKTHGVVFCTRHSIVRRFGKIQPPPKKELCKQRKREKCLLFVGQYNKINALQLAQNQTSRFREQGKGTAMTCFVTGIHGQLGRDTAEELRRHGHAVYGSGTRPACSDPARDGAETVPYLQLDITDKNAVLRVLDTVHPDIIVHCAAWTAVDAAEAEENRAAVRAVNVDGTRYLAEAAEALGAKMIYISTDYVFDGSGTEPWSPDCEAFCPLNYYGQTKLEGEQALRSILDRFIIVRTSWVFGENGNNFVRTILRVGRTHDAVRVVNDQIGTPTYTRDLARLLADMSETEKYGVYHATNEGGYVSWYAFTKEIYRQAGVDTRVIPVTTEEYGLSAAKRPFNSRLDKSKLIAAGFAPLPPWQDALGRYLKEIAE